MNASAAPFAINVSRLRAGVLAFVLVCVGPVVCPAAPSFVYESPNEFLASGDFNGDGVLDVLVLDKSTGNARVGYGNASGDLTWSAPLVTGVANASGCAVGTFLFTSRAGVAVTAPSFNEINLVDLSGTNTAGAPMVVTPSGLGPHTVLPLADPLGGAAPSYNDLLCASSNNSGSAELLDLLAINAGTGTESGQYGASGPFDRGNAVQLSVTAATFAAGMVRGESNDTFDVWQFTNTPGVMVSYPALHSGSDYAFGIFNAETLPRFFFYQPGGTNIMEVPLRQPGGVFTFGAVSMVSVSEPIQEVYYESNGTNSSALILFSNGVQSLTFPGGSPALSAIYSSGAGASGNVFTGVVPLANGMLALLDGPPGGTSSVHDQVLQMNGATFTQLSAGNLPPVTARNTRANVWLFQTEPFVNRQPGFIASFNTPDWSDGITGLPGALSVSVQNDGGASTGLGTATTSNLGAPPTGSTYGLVNQYNTAISVFSYSSPQAAQHVTVFISPTPGLYDGPIPITFSTLNASDKVFYRLGAGASWQLYTASFTLTNDNTIQYFGTNAAYPIRSLLQTAAYSIGINTQPTPTVNLETGTSTTNPPPPFIAPSNIVLSPFGTIFYGRRSITGTGSIWAINYDGSGDTYITAGVRPRVSRDGNWMVFMRGGKAFVGEGNIWIHNLQTGQEHLLFENTSRITCYDWALNGTGIIMDYDCGFWMLDTNGSATDLAATDCYEQAPVFSPVNGRVAYHDLNPDSATAPGIYVAASNGASPIQIVTTVSGASWPEWSPDGSKLSFTDDNTASSQDLGTNLWVASPDGSDLSRICDFTGTSNHFPHGAVWSPDSTSLVGAGTIYGTNGLWIIPLNYNRTDCQGAPTLLPTTPGDAIDFAGSIVVGQPPFVPPNLVAQRGSNSLIIVWSTNFPNFTLEYSLDLTPPIVWLPITGPYSNNGINFEYEETFDRLLSEKIFRLTTNSP